MSAVNRGPDGNFVYVVDANHRVTLRPVTLAGIEGNIGIIRAGVSAGETVVTDGQIAVTAGSIVRIVSQSVP
jgi:multidrug efflux system membrane fusion protein